MAISDYISIPIFVASFIVGLFFVSFGASNEKVVRVFPTPDNVRRYQYQDNVGTCYTYDAQEKECGDKPENIPVQSSKRTV